MSDASETLEELVDAEIEAARGDARLLLEFGYELGEALVRTIAAAAGNDRDTVAKLYDVVAIRMSGSLDDLVPRSRTARGGPS